MSKLDGYPIPKLDNLYRKLVGGETFAELDLSLAFEQMPVDEKSKGFWTINTHKVLHRYNRFSYGVTSALGIFQRTMEGLIQGIPQYWKAPGQYQEIWRALSEVGLPLKAVMCQFIKITVDLQGGLSKNRSHARRLCYNNRKVFFIVKLIKV